MMDPSSTTVPGQLIPHSKPWITPAEDEAVRDVMASGMLAQGHRTARFEQALTEYLGGVEGVATSSGTSAITLGLRALGLAPRAEIVLPTYVCRSVADAVTEAGLVPVLCDVGDEWNMVPETVAPVITGRTGAIIVVHVFGIAADVRAFERFGVPIVEDVAQAFGGRHGGRTLGTTGTVSVFSFQATKCLTTGEGGYVGSVDPSIAARVRELAVGRPSEFTRVFSPLTDLQAALGLSQLARYDDFLVRRRLLADRYFAALADLPVSLPTAVRDRSMFFRFPVRVRGVPFAETQEAFLRHGVHVRRGVDALLHRTVGLPADAFPGAERAFAETVSLPLYPALTDDEQDVVIDACRAIWSRA